MMQTNLTADLDWEVQVNMIGLLENVFFAADENLQLDYLSTGIESLVSPLVDSLDNSVSERAMDLLSRISGNYSVALLEERKLAMAVDELNGLISDVVFRLGGGLSSDARSGNDVIVDCY